MVNQMGGHIKRASSVLWSEEVSSVSGPPVPGHCEQYTHSRHTLASPGIVMLY